MGQSDDIRSSLILKSAQKDAWDSNGVEFMLAPREQLENSALEYKHFINVSILLV